MKTAMLININCQKELFDDRSFAGGEDDLDATVLGTPFGGAVVGDRPELGKAAGREALAGDSEGIAQELHDTDRPRRGEFPVARID